MSATPAMSVADQRALRRALGQFPTGVCIVTCQVAGERLGMTMSSFNTLSLDPPLVLFSIDRRAKGLPRWQEAQGYAVNVLAENQKELSNRFARSLANKWEGVDYTPGHAGAPVLPGTAAVLECAPWAQHDGGDHVLFIAEVKRFAAHTDRTPLVFSQGRYASLDAVDYDSPLWPLDIHY